MVSGLWGQLGDCRKKGGCHEFCFLLFICMVSLNVVSTWYHLICKKKINKRGGSKGGGKVEGGRKREGERGRKREIYQSKIFLNFLLVHYQ